MKLASTLKTFSLLCSVIIVASCASAKKQENPEMGAIKRLYQNTTARFNGYFNANELVKASMLTIEDTYQDNYNQILPLYEYVALKDASVVGPDMDKAVEKLGVVVNLHPNSDWVDDCYVLAGKASFLKHDYERAEEILVFLTEEFNNVKLAQRYASQKKTKGSKKKRTRVKKEDGGEKMTPKDVKNARKQKEKEREKKAKELKKKRKKAKKEREAARKNRKKTRSKTNKAKANKAKEAKKTEAKKELAEKKKREAEEKMKEADKPAKPVFAANGELDKPFLVRDPAYSEGLLWLAKTYVERQRYVDAEIALEELEGMPNLEKKLAADIPSVKAHMALKRKEYATATTLLEQALTSGNSKKVKARYAFILSQLYQKAGDGQNEISYLQKVLKFHPEYEMTFRAKENLIVAKYAQGILNKNQAIRAFTRLLKDEKNTEYTDQIYYGMAMVEMESKNNSEAINYLLKSVENNSSNINQLTESYYLLANLYFNEDQFVESKEYFDKTISQMDKRDERYKSSVKYANNLEDIASNLEIIIQQDSLLAMAKMDDKAKRQLVSQIKKDEEKEERKAKLSTANAALAKTNASTNTSVNKFKNSSFFAYNDKALKKGLRDFNKVWGSRKLTDNWRRASEGNAYFDEDTDSLTNQAAKDISIGVTESEMASIFKDVPKTPEEFSQANALIEEALYNLGRAFRERLQLNDRTATRLEELLSRYPDTEFEMDAWYYLHLAYRDMGNASKSKYYYDLLTGKYPESDNAKRLSDPNYLAKSQNENLLVQKAYDKAFLAFSDAQYQSAYDQIQAGKIAFPDNGMAAKYDLLEAMSIGFIKGKKEYGEALQVVSSKYKDAEEAKRAREILRVLGIKAGSSTMPGGMNVNTEDVAIEEALALYKEDEKGLHYFIMSFAPGKQKITDVRAQVARFNNKYHKLDKLRVAHTYLGADTKKPILTVRKFENKAKAMAYFETAQNHSVELISDQYDAEMMVVSQNNYKVLITGKSLDQYRIFFKEKYLNDR